MSDFPVYYIFIPLISSFIGWLTNYLAVKLLFRPYREIRFLFFKIQGIFPKRRSVLTDRLSAIIADDLLHKEKLLDQFNENPYLDDLIVEHVKHYVSDIIQKKIGKIPLLSSFLGEGIFKNIEESFLSDFKSGLGPVKEKFLHEAVSGLDIKKAVEDYLEGLSMEEMENLIRSVLKKEFYFIEWSGAVLGFLIGLGQLMMVYWGGSR